MRTPEEEAYDEAPKVANLDGDFDPMEGKDDDDEKRPRQKLLIRCKACGKKQKMRIAEGTQSVRRSEEAKKWIARLPCGECKSKAGLEVEVVLAPRNWFQRLFRMK